MEVLKIAVGYLEANCYIIFDQKTKDAVVIDPGGDAEEIISKIIEGSLTPLVLINTHNHFDHIGANDEIKQKFNIKIYHPKKDTEKDQEIKNFGSLKLKFFFTPGHTADGLCILIEDHLFSGDTLFANSIGRTDLDSGDFAQLINSIKTKILTLPEKTIVHPGHGPDTTVEAEKKFNPFLK
ncbi:MAG: MBL fold metallo-hydrolase [Elusimicrobiota bacterium]